MNVDLISLGANFHMVDLAPILEVLAFNVTGTDGELAVDLLAGEDR